MNQSREIDALRKRLAIADKRAVEAELRLFRREEECGATKAAYDHLQGLLARLYNASNGMSCTNLHRFGDIVAIVTHKKDADKLNEAIAATKSFLRSRGLNAPSPSTK